MNPVGRGQGTRAGALPAEGVRRRRPGEMRANRAAMQAMNRRGNVPRRHQVSSASSSRVGSSDPSGVSQPGERQWRWVRQLRERAGGMATSCISFFQRGGYLFPFYNPGKNIENTRNDLTGASNGEERSIACHVVACYVRDYLIANCRHPQHVNKDGLHWTARVFRNDNDEISWTGHYIRQLADNNKDRLLEAVEIAVLRAFTNLTKRVNARAVDRSNDNHEHHFTLNIVLEMIQMASDHFSIINGTMKQYGPKVDEGALRSAFAGVDELHRGLNYPPHCNEAYKREVAIKAFFEGISEKFLEIALPNGPGDLEAPYFVKNSLWKMLKETVIPNVFADQMDIILDPVNLDSLVLSALNRYNNPKSSVVSPPSGGPPPPNKKLQELNEECGRLVKEVVTFLGPSVAKILLDLPHVQERIGEALGHSIYEAVSNRYIVNKAINSGIEQGLPSFHIGRWEKADRKKIFVPLKKVTMPDGREGLQPAEECSFSFAKNESEWKEESDQHDIEKDRLHHELLEALENTLNREIKSFIPNQWNNLCLRVRGVVDPVIEGVAGEKGLLVRDRVCKVMDFVLRVVVGKVLAIALFPVIQTVGITVDYYTSSQAKRFVERLHMDIHRNLLYNYLDVVVNALQLKGDRTHRHP